MLSVILYNTWVLANIMLAIALGTKLRTPIIKLTRLKRVFRMQIEQLEKPG
jgi:hypothetical protein